MLCLLPDSSERVRDNGDEEIDEPEVEDDDADDEEEARHEVLRVNHVVHERGPLRIYVVS